MKNLSPSECYCMRSLSCVRDDITVILTTEGRKNLYPKGRFAGDSSHRLWRVRDNIKIPRRACALARNDKIRNDTGRKSIKSKRGAEIRTSLYRTPTPPLADSECKESMCHSEGYNPEESPAKRVFAGDLSLAFEMTLLSF